MPRLILFAACREVLISARDDSLTLVGLLTRVQVATHRDSPCPAVADVSWEHVAIWEAAKGEEGQPFEERVELIGPDGCRAAEVRQPFGFPEPLVRVLGTVHGFPARMPGTWTLRLCIRRADAEDAWERVNEYPVEVVYVSEAEPPTSLEPPPNSQAVG